jgi:hypothetical protein
MTIPPSRFLSATRKARSSQQPTRKRFPIDVGIIRVTTGDPDGNLTMEWESLSIKKELTFLDFGQV